MPENLKIHMLVGAIAGTTPLLVNLIGVDARLIMDNFELGIFLGYLIKAAGLMTLGAFVVFVNSEVDLKKAFQLGIMAPAFVVGAINANNFSNARDEVNQLEMELGDQPISQNGNTERSDDSSHFSFSLISSAYADDGLIGEHNQPSTSKYLWYGITGSVSDAWFVVVGSTTSENAARQQANDLRAKNYDARVYPSFEDRDSYRVAIGAYLPLQQARQLKDRAIKDGLPENTRLWKWNP
jgi:hypothetical protein